MQKQYGTRWFYKKKRKLKNSPGKKQLLYTKIDQAQYSRIKNEKTDPSFFYSDADLIFKEVNSYDKTMVEKLRIIGQLEEKEKKSIFNIVD